jgi:two-component system chemotaxis response regulator CheY
VSAPSRTLLLIEDDRFMRRALEVSLRGRGFTVHGAGNGEDGLALARDGRPDLVLLDMLMPRMNGLGFLRALRKDEATRAIPVLVLSNSSREQDMEEARGLGIAGYIVKSNVSLQDLCDHITDLVRRLP